MIPMIYKIKDGFVIRTVGRQTVAVPVGTRTTEIHGVITLSESGCILWKALEVGADIDHLTALLVEQYDVDLRQARQDVEKFLEGLKEQNVLQ